MTANIRTRAGRGRCSCSWPVGRCPPAVALRRTCASGHRVAVGRCGRAERRGLVGESPGRAARPAARRARRDDPDRRARRERDADRDPAPTIAATSSRRPVMSPTARPIIAAGKMTSMPNRAGSGIWRAEHDPGERRQVPRDERRPDRGDPVAPLVGPPEPPEVADRQRERLVGQEVGHHRAPGDGHVPQPRRERGRVEQVARVEQGRQQDDRRATPGRSRRSRRRRTGPRRRTRCVLIAIASIGEKPASRADRP